MVTVNEASSQPVNDHASATKVVNGDFPAKKHFEIAVNGNFPAKKHVELVVNGCSPADKFTECFSSAEDFKRPDHVFPVKYSRGGALKKAGHTEAFIDFSVLAGLEPVEVLSMVVAGNNVQTFTEKEKIKIVLIADIIRYRKKREKLTGHIYISSKWGSFIAHCYGKYVLDGIENVTMVKGEIGNDLDALVRVHSECLTGDIFRSTKCDYGNQLALAMEHIDETDRGILVYLRGHERRGIGLDDHKLLAYNLQEAVRKTVQANEDLGLPVEFRDYDLGVKSVKLMTNN